MLLWDWDASSQAPGVMWGFLERAEEYKVWPAASLLELGREERERDRERPRERPRETAM